VQTLAFSKDLKERLNLIDRKTFLRLTDNRIRPASEWRSPPLLSHAPKGQLNFIRPWCFNDHSAQGNIGSSESGGFSPLRYRPGWTRSCLSNLPSRFRSVFLMSLLHEVCQVAGCSGPLTTCLNRRVWRRAESGISKEHSANKSPLSLAFIDHG